MTAVIGARATAERPAVMPPDYRRRHFLAIALFTVAVALVGPALGTSRSNQFLVNLWLVYSISALGFYLVFGLAGRFAFCQTFMMALGGYMSAWVVRSGDGRPVILGLAAAIAVTALVAAVIGVLVRKAQHFYFAIATFAVTEIGIVTFHKAESFTGPNGQTIGIPPVELFGTRFVTDENVFWLFLALLVGCLVLTACIERSPMRREALAARHNGLVATLTGIGMRRLQLTLFMLGSALGGLAGALIGHWQGVIGTDSFSIDLAIGLFLILLLGGVDSLWGPVIGSAVFVALPRLLQDAQQYSSIAYGLLLLVVVLTLPGGIAAQSRRLTQAQRRRLSKALLSRARRRGEVTDADG